MSLAKDRESGIHMLSVHEQFEELSPQFTALSRFFESMGVSNHDQGIAGSREEDIKTLRGEHKTNVMIGITSCK